MKIVELFHHTSTQAPSILLSNQDVKYLFILVAVRMNPGAALLLSTNHSVSTSSFHEDITKIKDFGMSSSMGIQLRVKIKSVFERSSQIGREILIS